MIYIFDKTQAIIKVLTNDDFTAAHLNFKINTATTFEFSLPASKALPSGSKYVATPHPLNDSKFIMLRLTERVDNTETIDYSAYELAYQELATDGYIEDKRPQNQSALNLMKIALDGSNWELNNVNVSGAATTNFYYVDRLSAISKVVDLLGGEIVFYIEIQGNAISGRYMDYLARQGADTSKVFASGSNLLTVERQSDTSGIYTAILPRGKGEEIDNGDADTPDGYGRRVNIADVEWKKSAGKPLDKPKGSIVLSDPDATAEWGQINGNARLLLQTYDDIDDVNVLISSAYKTLQSVNHPQIQYSATVADVGGLSLGDTVLIMHGDRNLSYKTRVFEVKYDLLSPDQTELSLGDDLSSNSITSQLNNLNAVADTTSSQTQWTINQIGRPGTTYGATAPDSPKVGDIWFKYLADGGTEIYRWNGDIWELLASPTTADDIAAAVTDAVTQANAHTDAVKQGLSTDIATAKSQAASLASTAEANAKSEAVSQFNRAQNALSDAKTDLTKSISSEASKAVAAANSQAQNYVNQAKSDITDTINALSVGGRNLLLNSKVLSWGVTNNAATTSAEVSYDSTTNMWHITSPKGGSENAGIYFFQPGNVSNLITKGQQWAFSIDIKGIGVYSKFGIEWSEPFNTPSGNVPTDWTRVSSTGTATGTNAIIIYFNSKDVALDVYIKLPKLETGNVPTDWTPAPEDVVLDYTTKDNKIKETITQYQNTNDGKVTKVQTDVTTALGQVATKISKTEYDQKTGELSKTINEAKDTADKSTRTIADIKEADGKRDSRISDIEKTAGEIKSTVSDLSTAQDKQSGYISTLQQKANGFEATVTKVDNLSVGGRNLYPNSRVLADGYGINGNVRATVEPFDSTTNMWHFVATQGTGNNIGIYLWNYCNGKIPDNSDWSYSTDVKGTGKVVTFGIERDNNKPVKGNIGSEWSRISQTGHVDYGVKTLVMYFDTSNSPLDAYIKLPKLETGNVPTDWTPAPEDVNSTIAKVKLTADEASAAVTKLTSADGIITKAQADIKVNADAITKKVSKEVYDKQTGEMSRNINEAKDTADKSLKTIGDYKTSNDKRVHEAESSIERTANAITEKVSRTDYDKKTGELSENLSELQRTADSISNFVRDSSGNISSDFQTALSKMSIISGSTLATSIHKQTATQISSALTDNNGKIISLINQDTSGVQIAGKNLAITADTTVDGKFWAKQVNAVQVNASNITVGTLNGSQVNITNVNVNSLVGNVSSFIQSNWNGKYSSTTITELGMTIGEFPKYGYDTTFDKTGMTFTTKDARYGYAKSHFGTNTIVSDSNQIVGYGTEISFGTNNGVGFDYFAIMAPGDNNLQFGKFTAPGHVSIAITSDKGLSPFFGAGVNILDDVHMAKGMVVNGDMFVNTIHGANAFNLFNIIKGQKICIPTSFRSNGTAETWLNIQM